MISRPLPEHGASGFRKRLLVLVFGLLSPWLHAGDHPIHISLCELRLNAQSGAFEVSVKIFIDDLETALQPDGFTGLHIGTEKESDAADQAIARYIQKHLRIETDGRILSPVFHGKEVTEDYLAVWCYVEYPAPAGGAKACRISNDILLELYDDQKNIMDIRMNATHKAYTILEHGRTSWSYNF